MRRLLGCLAGLILVGVLVGGAGLLLIIDPLNWNLLDNLNIDLPIGDGDVVALPTHTPSSGGNESEVEATMPVPVTSSDDCAAVASASGIVIDAEAQRATVPRNTLPNGNRLPNTQPRSAIGAQSARGQNRSEVMIQFTPESRPNERNAYIRQIGGTTREQIDVLNTYIVELRPGLTIDSLPESPIVLRAEINELAVAAQAQAPNDPRYGEQWGLPIVGLPQGWEGLPSRTVTVAVIDSGICAAHPDLQGRILPGFDFVDDDTDPADSFGHGCGVAGVIAANSNNNIGIAGVAPNVNILPVRVLDGGGLGNYADISNGIIWAADNGADIINLSLAGSTRSAIMEAAVAYAIQRGVIVIAAAGNFGSPNSFYPAAFPSVISVGSVDPSLGRSSFSNYGPDVDILAPGRDILTTNLNGDYSFETGTSFAAPLVSGITALTESFNVPLNTEDGILFLYPPGSIPDCTG